MNSYKTRGEVKYSDSKFCFGNGTYRVLFTNVLKHLSREKRIGCGYNDSDKSMIFSLILR